MLRICRYIRNLMRAIKVVFKNGAQKFYSSLGVFLSHFPEYVRSTIEHHIQRKKRPYKTNELTLTRINIVNKKK